MLPLPVTVAGRPFWLRRHTAPSQRQVMVLRASKDMVALVAGFGPVAGSDP